jgi:hypothetical protein
MLHRRWSSLASGYRTPTYIISTFYMYYTNFFCDNFQSQFLHNIHNILKMLTLLFHNDKVRSESKTGLHWLDLVDY